MNRLPGRNHIVLGLLLTYENSLYRRAKTLSNFGKQFIG